MPGTKQVREVVPTELVDIIAQEQLEIHLNVKSHTFIHKFVPPKDGVYTAAVKGVAHVELRIKIEAPRLRPLVLTGRGLLRLEFEGKKGTAYNITIETVPTGASVDTVLMIFSGAGRTARPLILRQPPKSHTLPPGPKDSIIPMMIRLAERHLGNVEDKNEFDKAFDSVLAQNPKMSRQRLETFVRNYHSLPTEVIRERFKDPASGRARRAALRFDDVVKAVDLIFPAEVRKLVVARGVLLPSLEQIVPALLKGSTYLPGDSVTLVGGHFAAKTIDNEIWLTMPDQGIDGPFIRKERVTPDNATSTELKFHVPPVVPGAWSIYVNTPAGRTRDLSLPIGAAALVKPVIEGIDPENMEPGMRINIRGKGMKKNPIAALIGKHPKQVEGLYYWINCVSKTDTWCVAELPQNLTAGTYDILIEGEHVAPGSNFSDGWGYNVQPGRYRIIFEQMECIHPRHDLWDRDADLVTLWTTVVDDSAWSKASSKYGDIGGGHPPVGYNTSDGNVFTTINENYMGFLDVRYGLLLVTELYDWGGDEPAKELAGDVAIFSKMAGTVVSIAVPIAGAAIGALANVIAGIIPMVAKLFGYEDKVPLSWGGPPKNFWTAEQLQTMASGDLLPPKESDPYVMRFGYGAFEDWYRATHLGKDPPGGYDIQWAWNSTGDWRVSWRIERGPVR